MSTFTGSGDFPNVVTPNPISLNAEDAFGVQLFADLQPKIQTGLPALNLWTVGHPFVGTMYMRQI